MDLETFINKLCKDSLNIKEIQEYKDKIPPDILETLVDSSYEVLWQKYGKRSLAKKILIALGEYSEKIITHNDKKFSFGYINDPKKFNNQTFYKQLTQRGTATIQVINQEDLKKYQEDFLKTIHSFPEYKNSENTIYVAGGFGALGNTSSFHNPLSRELRKLGYVALKKEMKKIKENRINPKLKEGYKFEALFDRMMFRKAGMAPPPESWHRDVMPSELILEDDEIFGGWINLDSASQYFSHIPGSHLDIRQYDIHSGFDKIEDNIRRVFELGKKAKVDMKKLGIDNLSWKIEIPPGHMVIFPQYILHEVVATKKNYDMIRQFTGWRLTLSDKTLHTKSYYNEDIFEDQAVPPIPGGMIPPLFSKNHGTFFIGKKFNLGGRKESIISWSHKDFQSVVLVENKYTKKQKEHDNSENDTYYAVPRFMRSLKGYKLDMYPKYTKEEREIYQPQAM